MIYGRINSNMILGRCLVLVSFNFFAILVLFFLFIVAVNIRIKSPILTSDPVRFDVRYPPIPNPKFSLLIGILTMPHTLNHRNFLRVVYGVQSSPNFAEIDIKFVLCNLTTEDQKIVIGLEILRFNDIIVLNCTENMNSGKTYTYFSSLPDILTKRYDYVMKADDDVFLRLLPLVTSLEPLPRLDLYYGFVIPCQSKNPFVEYMSGMGYILSWDIVEWIGNGSIPEADKYGPEDKLVGKWLNIGNKAKNRFSNKPAMYDFPGTNGRCSHELIPETVAVHRLKRWDQWLQVLKFFNITKELKDSNPYYL